MMSRKVVLSIVLALAGVLVLLGLFYLGGGVSRPAAEPGAKEKPDAPATEVAIPSPISPVKPDGVPQPSPEPTPPPEAGAAAFPAITGRVLAAESNAPLAGVAVRLALDGPQISSVMLLGVAEEFEWLDSASTDASGAFRIGVPRFAPFRLRAAAPGRLDHELGGVFPGNQVEIVLAADAGLNCSLVLDENGAARPLPGQKVKLRLPEERWSLETVTDAAGSFLISGIKQEAIEAAARGHDLEADVPGFANPTFRMEPAGWSLEVERGETIAGTVRDRASGSPIPGAVVRADSGHTAAADASGRYQITGVADSLSAFAPGYSPGVIDLFEAPDPDPAGVIRIDIRLERGIAIRGRVTDRQGSGIAGVRVGVASDNLDLEVVDDRLEVLLARLLGVYTDASGHYRLEGLAQGVVDIPGTLELEVRPPGSSRGVLSEVEVESLSGEIVHDITLDLVPVFSGTVRSADGSPVAGARVSVESVEDELFQVTATAAAGEFQFSRLTAGDYHLAVEIDGRPAAFRLVTIPSDPIDIRIEPGTSVTGRVVSDQTGEPIAGHIVRLMFFHGVIDLAREARTGDQGEFSFENVPPGKFTMVLQAPPPVFAFNPLPPIHRLTMTVEPAGWSGEIRLPAHPSGWVALKFRVQEPGVDPKVAEEPVRVLVVSYRSLTRGAGAPRMRSNALLGEAAGGLRALLREGEYTLRCQLDRKGVRYQKDQPIVLHDGDAIEVEVILAPPGN